MPDYATKDDLKHHKALQEVQFNQLLGQVKDISGEIKEVSNNIKQTLELVGDKVTNLEKQQIEAQLKWRIVTWLAGTTACAVVGVMINGFWG